MEVTPRERRVSRNACNNRVSDGLIVTPRERRVSRNRRQCDVLNGGISHASREACE